MERNKKVDVYLTLSKTTIEETKKEVNKEAIAQMGEDGKDDLYYPDCLWEIEELYFDEDDQGLSICGEFYHNGQKLGYLSTNIKLGHETIIEIIEFYMKKLGKLKTVMEAIKD